MSAFRAVLLALLVVGTGVAVLATGATADDAPGATIEATFDGTAAQNGTANGSALGSDISSFMQSSAAEVGGAVETGMWTAAYNATENRSVRVALVERRTDDLRAELADLSDRRQELADAREAGELSDAAYRARVGRIVGQINALESALDATETRAREVDAGVENVTALRSQTEKLAGPEIAAVARNLSGVGSGERGPPLGLGNGTDVGNGNGVGDEGPSDPENGNNAGTGNGVGNSNGVGAGGNGSPGNGAGEANGRDGGDSSAGNATTGTSDGTPGNGA